MSAAGLVTKDAIVADGKIHRFHVDGDKPGSKNGWYVLYTDSIEAGAFGSWKTGDKQTWGAKPSKSWTFVEQEKYRRRMSDARIAREIKERRRRATACDRAEVIWTGALPATDDHPYLMRKAIRNHGLRLFKGALVIPLRDSCGMLHSLQFIDSNGRKRFLADGRKGGCYFALGRFKGRICIAEGYATAASVHEATGLPVAVAFDAGNLEAVALSLRAKFPEAQITICADNDANTIGTPGLTKAKKAAAACGALLAIPPIVGDFNDLYRGAGR